MARFSNTPPTNAAPRAYDAADENAELVLPGAVPSITPGETIPDVAAGPADIPDTGIPDDLPILPPENFAGHLQDEAADALSTHNDLLLDFFFQASVGRGSPRHPAGIPTRPRRDNSRPTL